MTQQVRQNFLQATSLYLFGRQLPPIAGMPAQAA